MKVIYCGTVDIHVCPNGCNSQLATVATVQQDWKVDAEGGFVECLNEATETVHEPDNDNVWSCLECGAEAELYKGVTKYGVSCVYSNNGWWDFSVYIVDKETVFCRYMGRDGIHRLEKSPTPGFLWGKTNDGTDFTVHVDGEKGNWILSIAT